MSVYLPVAYDFANHWTKIVLLYCEVFQKFMIVSFIVFWEKGTSTLPEKSTIEKNILTIFKYHHEINAFLATFKLKWIKIKQF